MRTLEAPKNKKRFVPAYVTVSNDVRDKIRSGAWSPGAMLPGRRDLAKEYGVDVNTIQKAVGLLLDDGILRAEDRRGTFVSEVAPEPVPPIKVSVGLYNPSSAVDRSAQTFVVGVVANYYFSNHEHIVAGQWPVAIVHALERTLAAEPGMVVRCATAHEADDTAASMERQVKELKNAGVDALVVVLADMDKIAPLIGTTPTVYVGDQDLGPAVSHVYYDSLYAGYHATRHLFEHGYRDIVFFSPCDARFVQERLLGAEQFIKTIPSASLSAIVGQDNAMEPTYRAKGPDPELVRSVLNQLPGRGVVAVNDSAASDIMREAAAIGLVAGRDYGIIGFDDEPTSRGRSLSTMHPPLDAMGSEAARIIAQTLRGGSTSMQIRLHSYLIPRASTSPISR